MALSRTDKWILRQYEQYAKAPPGFLVLIKASERRLLLTAGIGAIGGYYLQSAGQAVWGWFVFGMAVGAMFRHIGQLRMAAAAAPLLSRVIDQQRVQDLLREDEEGVA